MKLSLRTIAGGLFIFIPGLILSPLLNAQTAVPLRTTATLAPLVPQQASASEAVPDRSQWQELENKRTLYSNAYTAPGGLVIMQYSKRPLNYYNEHGQLVPIDAAMKPSAEGWAATGQPYPVYFDHNGSASLTIGRNAQVTFGQSCRINGQSLEGKLLSEGNMFTFKDVVPGVDKEYYFNENSVKYNYVLNSLWEPDSLRITEEISFPQGYKLILSENGKAAADGWQGDIELLAPSGERVARFYAPVCYDAANAQVMAVYNIKKENGKQVLEMVVPGAWLHDPARSYPIVIDPLVVGPTSLWSSGQMPSCIMPAYNVDSLQVTIPAGITVTGFFVTASFYADPFTTATMSQGSMHFSTICDSTTSFTVPTGNTPGTAYLDSFDLRTPLMCCFAPSCTTRTFYLRMHLGRTGPSVGCNTTYIRYDPITTQWPFSAVVVGRTVESFGPQWNVPSTPICSNQCSITATTYVRYGVPPYTVSHPWGGTATIGTPLGCNTGAAQHIFTLNIPNCPDYCDTTSQLIVPPPIVTDACGNIVSGIPSKNVPLKTAPAVTATPPAATVCSGGGLNISLSSCVNGSVISWFGNNMTGTGDIADMPFNTSASSSTLTYSAFAEASGCYSDTLLVPVTVDPLPVADYSYMPVPVIANLLLVFADISSIYAGTAADWSWNFGDNTTASVQDPTHTFPEPGTYNVCMVVTTSNGCIDTVCKEITVIAPDVVAPNVVTPNGDGLNDVLKFKYLEYFEGNELQVFNRWGGLVLSKSDYANDWNAGDISDGTYFYVLTVKELGKVYKGFFEVLR